MGAGGGPAAGQRDADTRASNLADRSAEPVLDFAEQNGMAFIPYFPLATGGLASQGSPLNRLAERLEATPGQLALAWRLRRSPVMVPIPGTSTVPHLEENLVAVRIELSEDDDAALTAAVSA